MPNSQIVALLCAKETLACRNADASDDAIATTSDDLHRISDEVWSGDVTTFDDVLARALIARQHADRDPDTNDLLDLSPDAYRGDRANAELIEAVLRLAERLGHTG